MPFLRRRRAGHSELVQLVRAVEAIAQDSVRASRSAVEEIEELRRDAATTRDALNEIHAALDSLAKPADRTTGWKAARLWLYVALLTMFSGATALVGTRAFDDIPAATGSAQMSGDIEFFVGTRADLPDSTAATSPGVMFMAFGRRGSNWRADYDFFMPAAYQHSPFEIVLTGSAMVTQAETHGVPDLRSAHCTQFGQEAACQVLSGVLPTASAGGSTGGPSARSASCRGSEKPGSAPTYVEVEIEGRPVRVTQTIDPFHEDLTLPAMSVDPEIQPDTTEPFESDDLRASFRLLACRFASIPDAYEMTSSSDDPTSVADRFVTWGFGLGSLGETAVLRRRDAEQWGNVGVASAGAAVGLGIGFLPLAYEVTGAWRRRRLGARQAFGQPLLSRRRPRR